MFHKPGKKLTGITLTEHAICKKRREKTYVFTPSVAGITALFIIMLFCTGIDAFAQQEKRKDILTVGVRGDAPPFSYREDIRKDCKGECLLKGYAGFSVEICKKIAKKAIESGYKINVIEVTAQNRLPYLVDGTIDILCGATTVTLERMRVADFSLFTFVSGVSVMYKDTPVFKKREGNAVIKIGYLKSTTSEKADVDIIKKVKSELGYGDDVKIDCNHPQFDHYTGVQELIDGNINVYLADREILLALQKKHQNHPELVVSRKYFTIEPYAIGLNRAKPELQFVANTVLSELFGDALSYKAEMPILDLLRDHFPGSSFSRSLINLYCSQRLRLGSAIDLEQPLPCKPVE